MVENDANLAAFGEFKPRVAQGCRDAVHLKLVPGLAAECGARHILGM
ncbi:hypothetical protein [Amycolatopsis acidicola]|nr:hypothetical protein [Amycolatopsis acidicola]